MADEAGLSKKASSINGIFIIASLLVAMVLVVWLFAANGMAQVTAPTAEKTPLGNDVSQAKQFIWYNASPLSPTSTISFQYPVGYYVEESNETGVAFRATASVAGEQPEVLELTIDNTTTASSAFSSFQEDMQQHAEAYKQVNSKTYTNSRSKQVRLLTGTTLTSILPELTNTTTHITMAFFDCHDDEAQPYTALFSAFIPTTWQSDASLFEKTIDTFTC